MAVSEIYKKITVSIAPALADNIKDCINQSFKIKVCEKFNYSEQSRDWENDWSFVQVLMYRKAI